MTVKDRGGGVEGRYDCGQKYNVFTLAFPQGKAKVLILPRSIDSFIDSFTSNETRL